MQMKWTEGRDHPQPNLTEYEPAVMNFLAWHVPKWVTKRTSDGNKLADRNLFPSCLHSFWVAFACSWDLNRDLWAQVEKKKLQNWMQCSFKYLGKLNNPTYVNNQVRAVDLWKSVWWENISHVPAWSNGLLSLCSDSGNIVHFYQKAN